MAGRRRRIRTSVKVEKISKSPNERTESSAVRKFNKANHESRYSSSNSGSRSFDRPKIKRESRPEEGIRLNKYLANAGIASRREADKLIESGVVEINGKVITELGTRVKPGDEVKYDGATVKRENPVYLLLNKPKDFITTLDDPKGRRTVMDLVRGACPERVFPVGRLDRMTTGLLMLTNDGDLAKRLTHPQHGVRKLYQVTTDRKVHPADLEKLLHGVTLNDGVVKADKASLVPTDKDYGRVIGVELHSGKNRVVRRMFESMGYKVQRLDRVMFAGLSKKQLSRGQWRFLTEKEVNYLKMLG